MSVRLRLAALWTGAAALVAAGFASSWSYALGAAARYAQFASGKIPESDIDWAAVFGVLAGPLFLSGFLTAFAALAVHSILWRATPREPSP